MSWADPVADLRIILSDGPTDKLFSFKAVFGAINGTNTIFNTFEFRRLTDFSSTATSFPLGVYYNGNSLAASSIAEDNLATGYFNLSFAPSGTDQLSTTYYAKWFNDDELVSFLIQAANWLGGNDQYSNTPDGLKTAVLKYASHVAYQKLALKYAMGPIDAFRLQDAPEEKRREIQDVYRRAWEAALKEAYKSRDDYYTRKGQSLAPISGTVAGNISNPTRS